MDTLSSTEILVAKEYCKGLADKEVADNLNKSIWTVKTQKRTIYRKLGISKDTELLLYMIFIRLKRDFDLKEIRKHGIELLFSALFLTIQITCNNFDSRRMKTLTRVRTSVRYTRVGRKNNNDFNFLVA
ncbi:LuxR C-terminal-related transcriptional regulator [Bacteroides sp.]|uniref:helix-turn-helix transcriptional regulator n=1 Tax=Bacteroides sp. TaxID=29523 RepID=UPI0025BBA53B|nr:LuxR C-terminal-related transcriptional regulator [Bacteroides sp.]